MHKFVIHVPLNSHEAWIEMDGKRLEGITDIRFRVRAGEPPLVTLTAIAEVRNFAEFEEHEVIVAERKP